MSSLSRQSSSETFSLRAGSLVWTGRRNRELARRMGRGKVSSLFLTSPVLGTQTSEPARRLRDLRRQCGGGAGGSHLLGPDNAIHGVLLKPLVGLLFNVGQTFEEVLVEPSVHCIVVCLAEVHLLLASDVHTGGIPVPSSTSRCGK